MDVDEATKPATITIGSKNFFTGTTQVEPSCQRKQRYHAAQFALISARASGLKPERKTTGLLL